MVSSLSTLSSQIIKQPPKYLLQCVINLFFVMVLYLLRNRSRNRLMRSFMFQYPLIKIYSNISLYIHAAS